MLKRVETAPGVWASLTDEQKAAILEGPPDGIELVGNPDDLVKP